MDTSPDLSYLAEDLRPQVENYLNEMKAAAKRYWDEKNAVGHSLAMRLYYDAIGKIRNHQWPL